MLTPIETQGKIQLYFIQKINVGFRICIINIYYKNPDLIFMLRAKTDREQSLIYHRFIFILYKGLIWVLGYFKIQKVN